MPETQQVALIGGGKASPSHSYWSPASRLGVQPGRRKEAPSIRDNTILCHAGVERKEGVHCI